MSLRGHLCLPAPGTATAAVRMEGASPRAFHAALAAMPSSIVSAAGVRQRFDRSGADAGLWRSSMLRRCTERPPQPIRVSKAQTAPLRRAWTISRPAVTARPCVAAADSISAPDTVHHQGTVPASRLTGATGRSRQARDVSSFSVSYRHVGRKPAFAAALCATASRGGGGHNLPTPRSVGYWRGANMSGSTPRQRAVAGASPYRWRARAVNSEPAEQDPDYGGNLSDGAEGDPEVSRRWHGVSCINSAQSHAPTYRCTHRGLSLVVRLIIACLAT
jgi:hypothetical protein